MPAHATQTADPRAAKLYEKALAACNEFDYEPCLRLLGELRENHPLIIEGYLSAAMVLSHMQRVEEAIDMLVDGLDVHPGHPELTDLLMKHLAYITDYYVVKEE